MEATNMVAAEEYQIVTDQLLIWQAYDPLVKCDLFSSAYRSKQGWVLIDPILLALGQRPFSLKGEKPVGILLSNGNHARASEFYREEFGCEILAAPMACEQLGIKVNRKIKDQEDCFGVKCHAIPGAGVGEMAFLTPDGYLMLGDAMINLESHGLELLPSKYCMDARQNRLSLKTLLDYEFSIVTFAHGLPLRHHAKERLRALLEND